jgi:hypothetical protein
VAHLRAVSPRGRPPIRKFKLCASHHRPFRPACMHRHHLRVSARFGARCLRLGGCATAYLAQTAALVQRPLELHHRPPGPGLAEGRGAAKGESNEETTRFISNAQASAHTPTHERSLRQDAGSDDSEDEAVERRKARIQVWRRKQQRKKYVATQMSLKERGWMEPILLLVCHKQHNS